MARVGIECGQNKSENIRYNDAISGKVVLNVKERLSSCLLGRKLRGPRGAVGVNGSGAERRPQPRVSPAKYVHAGKPPSTA